MSDEVKVEILIDVRKFIEGMNRAQRQINHIVATTQQSMNEMRIIATCGHTDGAYAEVMLREHLHALARQGLTRKGAPHV